MDQSVFFCLHYNHLSVRKESMSAGVRIHKCNGDKEKLTIPLLKANVATITATTTAVIAAAIRVAVVVTSSVLISVVKNHPHIPMIGVGRCNHGTTSVARCHHSSAKGVICLVVSISRLG